MKCTHNTARVSGITTRAHNDEPSKVASRIAKPTAGQLGIAKPDCNCSAIAVFHAALGSKEHVPHIPSMRLQWSGLFWLREPWLIIVLKELRRAARTNSNNTTTRAQELNSNSSQMVAGVTNSLQRGKSNRPWRTVTCRPACPIRRCGISSLRARPLPPPDRIARRNNSNFRSESSVSR